MTAAATALSERLDESLRTITSISRAPAAVLAVVTGADTAIACRGDTAYALFKTAVSSGGCTTSFD